MAKINRNEKHQKYIKLLNSKRWKQLREWKLNKNPLCERCAEKGLVVSAVDIHHIKPVESVPEDQMENVCFNPHNLIALCIPCHIEIHRQMRSHEGQMKDIMHKYLPMEEPKPIESNDEKINAWLNRNKNPEYEPKPTVRKGVRKTKYGWVTMEEYRQKQKEELEAWANELKRRVDGYQNTEGTATVDVKPEN